MTKKNKKKSTIGKSAIKKGKEFEDLVADIYRLLGADVKRNIMICQKKVDILAEFRLPGSSTKHKIIVECKAEKRAINQNQRIMEFYGLLTLARKEGVADSGEIITRVPWSDQAKGFAHQSGLELMTYETKISKLINFTDYLKSLVEKFDKGDPLNPSNPPLGKYYVDLSAEKKIKEDFEKIPVINFLIKEWMDCEDRKSHLAILGEYGTGKSSLCQKITYDLAISYLKKPCSSRIPIFFNLRDFTKTLKIESLVTSFLDENCGVINPRYKLFHAMNDAGIFLIIFDGFDEMAVRVDSDTLESNLQEFEKLASSPKSKIIITSRIEYFISSEEERKSLRPKGELLATRTIEYEPLKLVPWKDEQIELFLKKRVPLIQEAKKDWTYYWERIKTIPGLSDLSRRPVLLEMIVKTLPQLIESGKTINRPNLYETYLLGEIKRQKITKGRPLLLPEEIRFNILQKLAIDFYEREIKTISFDDALNYIKELVKPARSEIEAFTRDFLTCSFLVREGDNYHFSHRSIMEYLSAKFLKREIDDKEPKVFKNHLLEPVVTNFIVELGSDINTLFSWLESTKNYAIGSARYLGGNAATLIYNLDPSFLSGKDLSNTILTGANLSGSNLLGTNLKGAVFKNVNLVAAQFLEENFSHSIVDRCRLSITILFNLVNMINTEKEKAIDSFEQIEKKLRKKTLDIHQYWISSIGNYKFLVLVSIMVENHNYLKRVVEDIYSLSGVEFVSFSHDQDKKLSNFISRTQLMEYEEIKKTRIKTYFLDQQEFPANIRQTVPEYRL